MISRRLLRIKVLQLLFAYFKSGCQSVRLSEKELFFSINKAFELYHYLLLLLLDVADYAEARIELAKQKKIPTFKDLNPSTRFIDNPVILQIRSNKAFKEFTNTYPISWINYPELIKRLYNEVLDSEYFEEYIASEKNDYKSDKELIIRIFETTIAESELLHNILEEQSIYWNDDTEFILSMILQTLSRFGENNPQGGKLMNLYKNEEDRDFVKILFRRTIQEYDELNPIIERFAKNWEIERIAFMDILIMQQAITEIMEFQSIPIKVSFNEYIEIAKFYSTEKSSVFINGILDKIIQEFRASNKIVKTGRGLIGEEQ